MFDKLVDCWVWGWLASTFKHEMCVLLWGVKPLQGDVPVRRQVHRTLCAVKILTSAVVSDST